jgi:hypothetical protein
MQQTLFAIIMVLLAAGLMFSPGCKGGRQNGMKEGNKEAKLRMVKNPLATPEENLKAFLDLDCQGKRLTSKTWSKLLPYISWQEEAGWDRVTVITGYVNAIALITVRFDVLGLLVSDYHLSRGLENVAFTEKKERCRL